MIRTCKNYAKSDNYFASLKFRWLLKLKKHITTIYEKNTIIFITFITQHVIWVTIKIGKNIEYSRRD